MRASLTTSTRQHLELEISFFAVTVLSAIYVAYDLLAEPRGGHPFGHWLGISGTLLMVMTETVYSLRKRTRLLNWSGPVRRWLSLHIITGIVGPFLVLMHTGLQFRGLAGFTMLLTVLVVASGFVGRYLFSGLQRALQGAEGELQLLAADMAAVRSDLLLVEQRLAQQERAVRHDAGTPAGLLDRLALQLRLRRALASPRAEQAGLQKQFQSQIRRKQAVERAMGRREFLRRGYRLWHLIHVPIGVTLFTSIAIHIAATLFFRAGLFG